MSTETLDNAFDLFKRFTKSDKDALELVKLFKNEVEVEVKRTVEYKTASYVNKEDLVREVSSVKESLQSVKADLIKWMFIFIMGLFASLTGVMFAIARFIA